MSKLLDTIKLYEDSKAKIFAAFDTSDFQEIDNLIGIKWYLNEYDELSYLNDEDEYLFESANQVGEAVDGLLLFYVQENGEQYYVIFDVESKLSEEEAEELFNW